MDRAIEQKWRKIWEDQRIFEADPVDGQEKVLVTVPFPYMNGPLHVGHAFTDGRIDVYARFKRMQGINTLFPWAWHWTGQPLVAAADRLAKGDPAMVKEFVEIERVPAEEIPKFYDPVFMARYYTSEGRESLKELGLSIDWRREFHTTELEPAFNKFVLWQMNKLREKGYITRGTHPVVWCPNDHSPTGDHDRLEGEGVTWEEFILVLFPSAKNPELLLPAATLRPETIFGVTNIWVNPEATYCEVTINGKNIPRWIVSLPAVAKLTEQLKKIEVMKEFTGRELVGSEVEHPLDRKKHLLVLPGGFVDPDNGSGIVYGVPAHAPADYVALRDLKNDSQRQREFGLSSVEIEAIHPISLITIPSAGEYPAIEIVEKMGIKNQDDPMIAQATTEIYRKEFHQGVMNENSGSFQGMRVTDAKPKIVELLTEKGLADHLYELPEKVVCRCTTECIVKVLEDQWFLRYSDPEWKKLAHECIDNISMYPESARQWFHDVIDWFKDWPCARRVGLGTPLPWSPGWIVETLSDSTIYMAFYTVISTIRAKEVHVESLTQSLFDYVMLSEGPLENVLKETKLKAETVEEMRNQFRYWYPVNLRNSAKELIPNHLTFFVFQHVAFFPKEFWPTGISANGMLTHDGAKMSKSKGNLVTLKNALHSYGADVVRASVLGGSEGLEDVDWREKDVLEMKTKIDSLSNFVISISSKIGNVAEMKRSEKSCPVRSGEEVVVDQWLESQIQRRISSVVQSIEQMKTKTAFHEAFYNFWSDVRHYLKRTETPSPEILSKGVDIWIKLLSPFIPFTSEELNSAIGGRALISTSEFPVPDPKKLNVLSELNETLLRNLIEDAQAILKLLKERPHEMYVFLAPEWTYELVNQLIQSRKNGSIKTSELLNQIFLKIPNEPRSEIANSLPRATKILNQLGDSFVDSYKNLGDQLNERRLYELAKNYLEKDLGVTITFQSSMDVNKHDPKGKARFALPFKPALYFE